MDQRRTDYRVIPDLRRQDATEIIAIDSIRASEEESGQAVEYFPLYSLRHHLDDAEAGTRRVFWHTRRTRSGRQGDGGTDLFVSFCDLDLKPRDPGTDILAVHAVCSNRDLPARLPFNDPSGDFTLEIAAPVLTVNCLVKPTPTRRPFLDGSLQWRLISHLSLNYLSLVEGGEDALKEILTLYDFHDTPSTRQQINGIVSLESRHVTRRLGHAFCRGVQTTMTFDEDRYAGSGFYLFAGVLERFLGQYVSVNAFSQLIVKTLQRKEVVKAWPPRSGRRILL
jgi:type VI secretion system protein ImpG